MCSNFFFQAKKKEAKKSPGHLRLCPGLKAPGRNYKLLPALATNSPPDCSLNASRPQRFKVSEKLRCVVPATLFGKRGNKRLFSHCMDKRLRLFDYCFKQKQVLYFKLDNLVCFILMTSYRRAGGLLPPPFYSDNREDESPCIPLRHGKPCHLSRSEKGHILFAFKALFTTRNDLSKS